MSRSLHGQLAAEFNPFGADYLAEILEAVAVAWGIDRVTAVTA